MEHLAEFKVRYLKQLASVGSFRDSYVVWGPHIREILGDKIDGQSLFMLISAES